MILSATLDLMALLGAILSLVFTLKINRILKTNAFLLLALGFTLLIFSRSLTIYQVYVSNPLIISDFSPYVRASVNVMLAIAMFFIWRALNRICKELKLGHNKPLKNAAIQVK